MERAGDRGLNAFVDYPAVRVANAATGPLAGLTLGVKDIIDVAGYPTGCGNPLKRAESPPASVSAGIVQRLLDAGARFAGKTQTDELAYSLMGDNAHYGTPVNSAAPNRLPGGSSSGSAAATAAGAVDIGLGSDTGGSIRAPASFCGLYGIRTTHGTIPLDGFMPLAPSYDTAGWLARDPETFAAVGAVLLPESSVPIANLVVAEDAFALLDPGPAAAFAPEVAALRARGAGTVRLGFDFPAIYDAFRIHQGFEAWQSHGAWIESRRPKLGPAVAARFAMARAITPEAFAAAQTVRAGVRARLDDLLDRRTALVLPSTPDIAPLLTADAATLDAYRGKALSLLCLAGHSGRPQVSIPGLTRGGAPLGLGLLGPRGCDRALLALAGDVALTARGTALSQS